MDSDKIPLTKQDVARRQIDTAIYLWFHSLDPVSTQTLVAAATGVLHDVSRHQDWKAGKSDIFFDGIWKKGMGKAARSVLRKAENFFKHAKDDPEDTFHFPAETPDFFIYSASDCYKKLYGVHTHLMALYSFHFSINNAQYFDADFIPRAEKEFPIETLRNMSRIEFYSEFFESPPIIS